MVDFQVELRGLESKKGWRRCMVGHRPPGTPFPWARMMIGNATAGCKRYAVPLVFPFRFAFDITLNPKVCRYPCPPSVVSIPSLPNASSYIACARLTNATLANAITLSALPKSTALTSLLSISMVARYRAHTGQKIPQAIVLPKHSAAITGVTKPYIACTALRKITALRLLSKTNFSPATDNFMRPPNNLYPLGAISLIWHQPPMSNYLPLLNHQVAGKRPSGFGDRIRRHLPIPVRL